MPIGCQNSKYDFGHPDLKCIVRFNPVFHYFCPSLASAQITLFCPVLSRPVPIPVPICYSRSARNAVMESARKDEFEPFEEWLVKSQGIDPKNLSVDDLAMWRSYYEESQTRRTETPKVGLMKLPAVRGEHRYAIAIRDDAGLWLTLWVKRTKKGEFFVLIPRSDREWDGHASYHLDGSFHSKSFGRKFDHRKKQPLNGTFTGTEHLGGYGGHGASIGAVCDPSSFNGVVEATPDQLGPYKGQVIVDLVEPGCEPLLWPRVVRQEVFDDIVPNVVIRIAS